MIMTRLIVKMRCAYQDRRTLFLCMDYYEGADLRYHLCQYKLQFSENMTSTVA